MGKKYNVLLTGVGREPGLSSVKALRRYFGDKIKIVGVDANQYAAGLYLEGEYYDKTYMVPRSSLTSDYLGTLNAIMDAEGLDLVLPGSDDEAFVLSSNPAAFKNNKRVIVSPLETVETCRDKWRTHLALQDVLPVPHATLDPREASLPCIIKPRTGHGARGICTARNAEELAMFKDKVENPMFQEYIEGAEWTIDCVCSRSGELIAAVPRKRSEYAAGTSVVGETVRDAQLMAMASTLTKKLHFSGPFCFQAREGKLFEINPRIGAASIFSAVAGANTAAIAVLDYYGEWQGAKVSFNEIIMTRYLQEVFIEKSQLKECGACSSMS